MFKSYFIAYYPEGDEDTGGGIDYQTGTTTGEGTTVTGTKKVKIEGTGVYGTRKKCTAMSNNKCVSYENQQYWIPAKYKNVTEERDIAGTTVSTSASGTSMEDYYGESSGNVTSTIDEEKAELVGKIGSLADQTKFLGMLDDYDPFKEVEAGRAYERQVGKWEEEWGEGGLKELEKAAKFEAKEAQDAYYLDKYTREQEQNQQQQQLGKGAFMRQAGVAAAQAGAGVRQAQIQAAAGGFAGAGGASQDLVEAAAASASIADIAQTGKQEQFLARGTAMTKDYEFETANRARDYALYEDQYDKYKNIADINKQGMEADYMMDVYNLREAYKDDLWNTYNQFTANKASSDIALKENIDYIGKTDAGLDVYEFGYKEEDGKYIGVMAQDLLDTVYENAVSRDEDGYLQVDYNKLDIDFRRID